MNKSLGTFMLMAFTVTVMITLVLGIAFESLHQKNTQHEEMMKTEHQLKFK
ncbi:hypothetical protein [Mesobacillus zeae]|uniref:hypothetical protein n=1 Tax=Mesobacillus zeae TaxID=1917180 RepID=UPI0030085EA6